MNWYYADRGRQAGPVGEAELDELVRSGSLASSALVWSEGMADWKPYTALRVPRVGPSGVADTVFLPNPGGCVCCGQEVLPNESVVVGKNVSCPKCKPVFVERLREADLANLPGAMPYSGFWIRFTARMTDYTLLTLVQAAVSAFMVTWAMGRQPAGGSEFFTALGVTALAGLVLSCLYETAMLATCGATVGKMLCYIRVVRPDGSRIGVGRALGRYFAELLSRFTGGIGLLMAGFDMEKRALHDRIAGTRVIDVPPSELARTELQPVGREIRCASCQTEIPFTEWNSLNPIPCPGCNTSVQSIVFPAVARSLSSSSPQAKEVESEASCYYHDANRASIACEECGRFLCPLCDIDAGTRRLCPSCFNSRFNSGVAPEFVQRRTLYDSIALTAAVLPNLFLLTIYFTLFTAPAVVGFSIWSWKKQGSITPRTSWRFVVAVMIASVNLLFIGAILVTLLAGAIK